MSTACHQIEVFSRVLKTSASAFLEEGEQTIDNNLPEFSVSLKNFHIYSYSQLGFNSANNGISLKLFSPLSPR